MQQKPKLTLDYHFMAVLAVGVGALAIPLQLVPSFELLAFVLSVAALGGVLTANSAHDDQARQRQASSYRVGFESLLLIIVAAYAIMGIASWMGLQSVSAALSTRWPGLLLATMCLVMGLAGLRAERRFHRSAAPPNNSLKPTRRAGA